VTFFKTTNKPALSPSCMQASSDYEFGKKGGGGGGGDIKTLENLVNRLQKFSSVLL